MNWNTAENKELVQGLLSLRTPKEMQSFLRDLMTENEIVEFSLRLKTAQMLTAGETYPTIMQCTGLSQTTIARVSKWLKAGENGYALVISRLHHSATSSGGRVLR